VGDLVPIVVAAGEQHDRMFPADVADATAAGRAIDRTGSFPDPEVAGRWEEKASAAFDHHARDESVVAR
jgi:hypothetical protein